MVKSTISKKQSKALESVKPTGSNSMMKNQYTTIASSNFRVVFEDHHSYNESILMMIKFWSTQPEFGAFNSFTDVVSLSTLFKCAFYAFRPIDNL